MTDTQLYHYVVIEKRKQHVYLEPEEITGMDDDEISDLVFYKLDDDAWDAYDSNVEDYGLETF